MKAKKIIDFDRLKENLPAKVICIILAVIFYMVRLTSSVTQKSFPVNLNVKQDGKMVCTTHLPYSISVTIKTDAELLPTVSASNISATLDLNYFTEEGDYEVPVIVDMPVIGTGQTPVEVIIRPERIKVHLEEVVTRPVKIDPVVVGTPAYGYELVSVEAEPAYAMISGPKKIVDSVSSIQSREIVIDKVNKTFKLERSLVNTNRMINIEEPENCQVKVGLAAKMITKSFKKQKVSIRRLSPEFEIDREYAADFILKGPQLVLEDFEPNRDALSVNCSSIKEAGEYDLPVTILIPNEVSVVSISVENIHVSVKDKPVAEADVQPDGGSAVQ